MIAIDPPVKLLIFPLAPEGRSTHGTEGAATGVTPMLTAIEDEPRRAVAFDHPLTAASIGIVWTSGRNEETALSRERKLQRKCSSEVSTHSKPRGCVHLLIKDISSKSG